MNQINSKLLLKLIQIESNQSISNITRNKSMFSIKVDVFPTIFHLLSVLFDLFIWPYLCE